MKKIKLITPLLCIPALGSISAIVTSCGESSKPSTGTFYDVSINMSDRFTYDAEKVGTKKATKGEIYTIKLNFIKNFGTDKDNIVIKVGDKQLTNFTYYEGMISISSNYVVGNIDIKVTPILTSLYEIDPDTNQLLGFASGATKEEINFALKDSKGKLIIPRNVTSIAPNAFYDATNDASTIPDFITDLKFDEFLRSEDPNYHVGDIWNIEGYSNLFSVNGVAGIGKNAFKKSPFKHIKLPVGQGYFIDNCAFEDSKVEVLEMPEPDYLTGKEIKNPYDPTDEEIRKDYEWYEGEPGEYTVGTVLYENKMGIDKWKWFKRHKTVIKDKAFYNTKNLMYISLTPFVEFEENATSCFMLKNSQEGQPDVKSNVQVIDWTHYNWWGYINEGGPDPELYYKMTEYTKSFRESGAVDPAGELKALASQFKVNDQFTTNADVCYFLMPDYWELTNPSKKSEFIREYLNQTLAIFGLPDKPENETPFGLISTYNLAIIQSRNNLFNMMGKDCAAIDLYGLKEDTVEISASSQENERYQELRLESTDTSIPTQYIKDLGLKGDFEYEITNIELPEDAPQDISFTLKHIKRSELPEAERADYKNNKFTVLWNKKPSPGRYSIYFNLKSLHTCRETTGLGLYIDIVA